MKCNDCKNFKPKYEQEMYKKVGVKECCGHVMRIYKRDDDLEFMEMLNESIKEADKRNEKQVICKNLDEISTIELIEELKKRDKIRVESAYETEIISIGDRTDERIVFEMDSRIVVVLNKD
ncbi:MAG: hypothetical protein ACRC7S_17065 [Cetobacterium sp.]